MTWRAEDFLSTGSVLLSPSVIRLVKQYLSSVCLSCFQGPTGFPGSAGRVGPPGPTVSSALSF